MPDILEGTLETPLGKVPKKTAAIVAGGLILVLGIVWYRSKQQSDASAAGSSEINPATGYPYGSAEDAASLAAQAGYISPGGGGVGGGSGGSGGPFNTGYVDNASWVQGVIKGMTEAGIIEDPTQLSAALGKYITGQPAGDLRSMIEQAIAWGGYPPISGSNGYPPSINTQNPVVTTPPPPDNTTPPPTGSQLPAPTLSIGQRKNWIELRCTPVAGATGYRFYQEHEFKYGDVAGTGFDWWVANQAGNYRFAVAAIKNGVVGVRSAWSTVQYTVK